MPQAVVDKTPTWEYTIKRQYPKLHNNCINSVSVCSNGINFISSDELSVFMWHIEKGLKAYNILEISNNEEEEITEVITSSISSLKHEHLFLVSTNKCARLLDLRIS